MYEIFHKISRKYRFLITTQDFKELRYSTVRNEVCARSDFRWGKIDSRLTKEFRETTKVSGLRGSLYTFPRYIQWESSRWRKSGSCTHEREHPDSTASGIVATVFSRFLRSSALAQREEILHPDAPSAGGFAGRRYKSSPDGWCQVGAEWRGKNGRQQIHVFFLFLFSPLSFDHRSGAIVAFPELGLNLVSSRKRHVLSVRVHSN